MEDIRFKNCTKGITYSTSLQLRTLIAIVGYKSVTLPGEVVLCFTLIAECSKTIRILESSSGICSNVCVDSYRLDICHSCLLNSTF
jgi:hypothetical protein